MSTLAVTYTIDQADPIHLSGDEYLVTGLVTVDTGDYVTNGIAVVPASFRLDTLQRIVLGHSSILGVDAYYVKATEATGKIKVFKDDIAGVSAEHGASAMTAQSFPFIAVGKKAA